MGISIGGAVAPIQNMRYLSSTALTSANSSFAITLDYNKDGAYYFKGCLNYTQIGGATKTYITLNGSANNMRNGYIRTSNSTIAGASVDTNELFGSMTLEANRTLYIEGTIIKDTILGNYLIKINLSKITNAIFHYSVIALHSIIWEVNDNLVQIAFNTAGDATGKWTAGSFIDIYSINTKTS